jgi:hypothetical protein
MAKLSFGLNFERGYGAPLDIDAVFDTTADMNAYLSLNRRYAGQLVTNLEEPGKIYILNNATDAWIEFSSGVSELGDITDVTITNLQTGQFLKYNGTAWVNSNGVESVNGSSGIVTLDTDDIPEGDSNKYYPSADASKLAGIDEGAQVNTVDSVNGETGTVVLDASDIGYDNTDSELSATAVQGAIDELSLKKANVSALSSNLILYPTTTASDISGYSRMVSDITDEDYDSAAVNVPTGTITTTDQLIVSLVSDAGLIIGTPGIVNIVTLGNIRKTSGNTNDYGEFFYRLYKRDIFDTETLLATSDTTGPVNPDDLNVYSQFSSDVLLNNGTWDEDDRIVIKYYANVISGTPQYQFQFGGGNPVRTLLPVPASVTAVNQTSSTLLTDTTDFDGILGSAEDTVQKALDKLDDLTAGDLGAITEETDPVFVASDVYGITSTDISNWDTAYG